MKERKKEGKIGKRWKERKRIRKKEKKRHRHIKNE